MRILKEGIPFILLPLAAAMILLVISTSEICAEFHSPLRMSLIVLSAIFVIFSLFCCFFFRSPATKINLSENYILSPCNGTVMEIDKTDNNETVIRTFLSIFNVHLQRSPADGIVKNVEFKKGKFYAAWNSKAESENQQNIISIETKSGTMIVRQISGFVARRCVSRVKPGDNIKQGQMIGLIKFGSQVDLHLGKNIKINIAPGDKVIAGVTVMGQIK
ncbi:MAG: phosphatidylserine decarboxylase family protein [Termitinemataceae bacterium]|nr:MAG: phosphatidylserine decarboxylase family protein [Termitinemataceae bacterium]